MHVDALFRVLGWVATCFTAGGLYLMGSKKASAWVVSAVGSTLWVSYALLTVQWPLVAVNLILLSLNLRGFLKWRRSPDTPSSHGQSQNDL